MKNIDYFKIVPGAMKNLLAMEGYFSKEVDLDPKLIELIKIRASQINGCAYCLNMHTVDALKIGETNQRIFLLNAWWETELFSPKEKAVLRLTDQLTDLTGGLEEEVTADVLDYFSEEDLLKIVLLISQINTWNRLNIAIHRDADLNYK